MSSFGRVTLAVAAAAAAAAGSFANAQVATSSASQAADGLTTAVQTMSASYVTVLNGGSSQTYRAIPTLPPSIDETPPVIPNIADPQAVLAQQACSGYRASGVKATEYGFNAALTLAGKACNAYGTDLQDLALVVEYQSDNRLNVKIYPADVSDPASANYSQYLISPDYVPAGTIDSDAELTVPENDLQFTWSNRPSFGFSVIRKSTGDVLFNTIGSKLVFENQFIEFVSDLPENYNLYGLGEHIHALRLGNNFTATIYAADAGDPIDGNIYGSHPFYLDTRYFEVDADGSTTLANNASDASKDYISYSHGVYLRNAHGQEILMSPTNVTWRTIGGSIDLYFFSGPDQTSVTKQYVNMIGLPALQKYHAFGYHQCRWGYENWTVMQEIVDNFRNFDIPLENIWNDIDYMNQYRDFDNDQNRFSYAQAPQFLDKLHANGQHYIPIVDSAIYIPNPSNASDAYDTYSRGHDLNAFMLTADGKDEYVGAVWPGFTVFPDWRSNGSQQWWSTEMVTWHKNVTFDGIWIDMSEASSFCVGPCGLGRLEENPVHPPFGLPGEVGNLVLDYPEGFNVTNATEAAAAASASASQSAANAASSSTSGASATTTSYLRTTPTPGIRNESYPPYVINNVNGALPVHAVDPSASHHDGMKEYDIHNLFGYGILNATYNALLDVFPGLRPLIIGRSTFVGSGKVAGHWGGDNYSQWRYMYWSIPQALAFSLFGIPMFGVDTCGFNGNSDAELCSRWMQLSAFFPFYRNHNTLSANPQEPYVWSSVIGPTKTAIAIRYSILPYMYTLFYQAHTTGSTVMRALAWEFPHDPSLASADRQFLLGPSLMVTPVLLPGATTVDGVFPGIEKGTTWFDWYTHEAVAAKAGQNLTIDAPLGHIPLYVRGGSILPMQQPKYTTSETRQTPWSLLVALSEKGTATGSLYLDDGQSVTPNATREVDLTVTSNSLYASGRGLFKDTNALANVTILGVPQAPKTVTFNGQTVRGVNYNSTSHVVTVTGLNNITSAGAWNSDWVLSWTFAQAPQPYGYGNATA